MGVNANSDISLTIEELNRKFGLPNNLCEMGLTLEMIPDLALHCVKDMCSVTNPRKIELL